MTGYFILALVLVLNYFALKTSYTPYKLVAGFSWVILIVYVAMYGTGDFAPGTQIQVVTIIILIGICLISLFFAFRAPLEVSKKKIDKNGNSVDVKEEGSSWHMPKFMSSMNGTEEYRQKRNSRIGEYRAKAHGAAFGARRRDNNGKYID